jgi:endonuclease/exonuclease/phosphatase family metal-dependent hydrolase
VLGLLVSLGILAMPARAECPEAACPFRAPTGFQWAPSTDTELHIWWQEVPRARAYRVQLSPNPYFMGPDVVEATMRRATASEPAVFKALAPARTYYLRATVVNREGEQRSDWSVPTASATKGAMQLSVGTYNIRNPDETWGVRGPWVADDIVTQQVQVLGVQEVYQVRDRVSLLDYVNSKSAQVNGAPVYGMAPAPESDLGYDNRILYDTRVVSLTASGAKAYDYQVGDGEVDRWFSWASLKHLASGWDFLVVTTHLAPGDDHADVQQWNELITRVNELKAQLNARWVVVAGDFNTTKFEDPAEEMLPKMQANGYGDVLGQEYRSYDTDGARALVRQDTWLNSFNGFEEDIDDYDVDKDQTGNSVDWIFASNDLTVPYYRVFARYEGDELIGPIASDHFLVWATLAYQPRPALQPASMVAASVAPSS